MRRRSTELPKPEGDQLLERLPLRHSNSRGISTIPNSRGISTIQDNQANIVTLVAKPVPETQGSTENPFIDAALQTLASKRAHGHRISRVSSVRDIDLELDKIPSGNLELPIRLQIIGHSLSGGLALGAFWFPESELPARAFKFPYYVLDTNPASLGLLSKHAGKISEIMLVSCNIGSAASFGHAINGRTLTYTLAELLHCTVQGADDVVAPDEFDARGWYTPRAHRRGPKGWRWIPAAPPVWIESSHEPARGARAKVA